MRIQPGRWFGLVIAVTTALHCTFPAFAAQPSVSSVPSATLLPAWFSDDGPSADSFAWSAALLPVWYAGHTGLAAPSSTTLAIAKAATPATVDQGDSLTYVITVTNRTAATAQQVVVSDVIPEGTVFEGARVLESGGATWLLGGLSRGQNGTFAWFTGDRAGLGIGLPGNASAVFELVVRAVGPFPDSRWIHNDAYSAEAGNADAVRGVDVATAVNQRYPVSAAPSAAAVLPLARDTAAVQASAQSTSLTIAKSGTPDQLDQGDLLTYVITVTNQTTEIAQRAVVTDTTPAGTVFESARVLNGGGTIWFGGGLSPGESGDHIWVTSDWLGFGSGLPGESAAVFEFVVRVVGPIPDQDAVHNDHYLAAADNADVVAGADVTTTVNAPAFALGKVASSDPVVAGQRLTYTIYLTNAGHLTTTFPYTIEETLPAHTAYAASSPPAQVSGDTLTWTLSSPLGIGQVVSVTFALTVTTPYTTGLDLVNDTYLAFSDEVTPTAQGPAITTTVLSWPVLSVSKAGHAPQVEAGGLLTYTLVVTNAGSATAPAEGTFVTDTLPGYVQMLGCDPSCTYVVDSPTVTWTLGTMMPGETRYLTLTGRVYRPLPSGSALTNQAAVSATNALATSGASEGTTVDSSPLLAVAKGVHPEAVTAGSTVTYTIAVTNTGNETASGAVVVDTLPGSFQFGGMLHGEPPTVSPSGDVVTWTNQTITPTADAIWPDGWISPPGPLTLVFTATAGGADDTYFNEVQVSRETVTATTGPTAPVIVGSPDLRLRKDDTPDPVMPGRLLTYTIVYSNASAVPATGVVVTDTLPKFVSDGYAVPAPDGGVIAAGETITWNVGLLDGYSADHTISLVVTLTLPITDGVVLTNVAGISCDEGVSATTGPVGTRVTSGPDLILIKNAEPTIVSPNDWVTYTLLFVNLGTAAAPGVVTDALPISLTQIVSTTTANVGFAGGVHPVYTWTVGSLAPSQWGRITITGRVITTSRWGQATQLLNTAAITTSDDVTGTNNVSVAPIVVVPGPPAAVTLTADPPETTVDCASVVTAEVRDAWGNGVQDGTLISFTTGTATSGAAPHTGVTQFGLVTTMVTSTRPGSVVVTATAPNYVSGATGVSFLAGAPHTFDFAPVADPQTAGVAFTIVFTAHDQFGNVAAGFAGTASLSDDTGTLVPSASNPAVGGVLSQSVTITHSWSGDGIEAGASGTTACGDPWTAVGSSNAFTVAHNLPAALALAPQDSTVIAGSTQPYAAVAADTYGNVWNGTGEVTFTTSGGNSFLGTPPGNNVFSATVAGVDLPVTGTIAGLVGPVVATTGVTVTHGPAVSLEISPRDAVTRAGSLVAYTAVATDAFGNAWTATADVSWAAGGGNAFFGNVLSATVAGTWGVTASLPAVSDSTLVTITAGTAASLAIAAVGDPQTAGVGFGLVVTAYDAFGNVAAGEGGNLNLSDATGTIAPTLTGMTDGVANPTVTIDQAWVGDRITASLVATPTILAVTNPFTVVPNVPHTVVYETPSSLKLCETGPVTVTVSDQWGNLVQDGTVVTLTSDGFFLRFLESGGAGYVTATSGGLAVATLLAGNTPSALGGSTIARAGSADSGPKLVPVTSPGVPYSISMLAFPDTIEAFSGTATITATVTDCAANPLSNETVAFAASFGTLNPLADVTDASGQVTTAFGSTQAGTAVISATAGGASGSVQVTVEPPENFVYLPLVLRNFRGVNLVVESITWAPLNPTLTDVVVVSVTVANRGPSPAGTFWVDLYLDPTGTAQPGVPWNDICDEGVAWRVPGLAGGQTLTLRSDEGAPGYTDWSGLFDAAPDPHELFAVVDSWTGPGETVLEDREDDNVLGPEYVSMAGP